jgi:hypothetical protein
MKMMLDGTVCTSKYILYCNASLALMWRYLVDVTAYGRRNE